MPPEVAAAENWTVPDVARFLRVTERTVHTYVHKGIIPAPRKVGAKWLFDAAKIRALVEQPAGA
jgi:excisionase family DNA binding protein